MVEGAQIFLEEEYDLNMLLSAFADQEATPSTLRNTDSPVSVSSDPVLDFDPTGLCIDDLERFLMSDEAEEDEAGKRIEDKQFFDGLFVDDSLVENGNETEIEIESDLGKSSVDSTEKGEIDKERDSDDGTQKGETDKERDSDDDPISKKIKRQMRNRDSAKSSRERKKQYVKELEMKSRFLESECKRLNYTLQCFMSENMALRQSMQCKEMTGKGKKGGPHSADVAMRESAVLLSESRQLGSLHCLVSITWFLLLSLLLPRIPILNTHPISPRREAATPVVTPVLAAKDLRRENESKFGPDDLYLLRRRCKVNNFGQSMNINHRAFENILINESLGFSGSFFTQSSYESEKFVQ